MKNSEKSSGPDLLLGELALCLTDERAGYVARERSVGAKEYRKGQAKLLEVVRATGRTGDIAAILTVEKAILENELHLYGNDKDMRGSLKIALTEMTVAQRHLPIVADPARYKEVDESHALPKTRTGGLPKDGARQALRSHDTRLLNLNKARLTETERNIIKARRDNLYKAQEIYTALQRQALGLPSPDKARDKGLER